LNRLGLDEGGCEGERNGVEADLLGVDVRGDAAPETARPPSTPLPLPDVGMSPSVLLCVVRLLMIG